MTARTRARRAIGVAGWLAVGLLATAAADPSGDRFEGRIVNMAGGRGANTARFTLKLDQVTPDADIDALAKALQAGGQKGLLEAVKQLPERGWVQVGENPGYRMPVIRSFDVEGGRLVRALTDRPFLFGEVYRNLDTERYPFGFVELKLDEKGEGEGLLILAAAIQFEKSGQIAIESYEMQSLRILSIRTFQDKD